MIARYKIGDAHKDVLDRLVDADAPRCQANTVAVDRRMIATQGRKSR